MPLYHIQDSDRPIWVVADNYDKALTKWKALIAEENNQTIGEVEDPKGIHYICDDDELLA